MISPPSLSVDRENPWPGLAPFTEDISGFFFGREEESRELFRLLKRETLTTLFGQSGLGKSSILQAGLFPRLRQADFVPVYVRLDHSPDASALAEQVKAAFHKLIEAKEIDATPPRGHEQTLWEYFHDKDVDFWTPRNQLATPVIVIDQFEEIFTLGRQDDRSRMRGEDFIQQLSDLIENRMPATVRQRIQDGQDSTERYFFEDAGCKVLLALREDFLPELEGLRPRIRSIVQNRMRIHRMNGIQAQEVIVKAGGHLVEAGVTPWIVHHVSASRTGSDGAETPGERLAEMEVEPALLSIFCRELNNKRIAQGQERISAELLSSSKEGILTDFYQRSMEDLPEPVRIFVEDKLLTASGFRDNIALENALLTPGVTREVLEKLVTRRMVRVEDRQGAPRLELTHDVLARPIHASRDVRQHRLALAKASASEKEARARLSRVRQRIVFYIAVAGLAISVPLIGAALWQRSVAMTSAAEATKQRSVAETKALEAEWNLKQRNIEATNYHRLLVQQAMNQSPPNVVQAQLVLTYANDQKLFEHAALADLLLPPAPFRIQRTLDLNYRITQLLYSPNGKILVARTPEGLMLIDAASGKSAQWIMPKDLEGEIKFLAFRPVSGALCIRVVDPGNGDFLVRWDYVNQKEISPRWRLNHPRASSPEADNGSTGADHSNANNSAQSSANKKLQSNSSLPFTFDFTGRRIAAVASDGSVALFNITSNKSANEQIDLESAIPVEKAGEYVPPASMLAFADGGNILLSQHANGTLSWNIQMSPPKLPENGPLYSRSDGIGKELGTALALSSDGMRMCSTRGMSMPYMMDVREDSWDSTQIQCPSKMLSAAFSIDDRWLVVGTARDGVQIYTSDQGTPVQSLAQSGEVGAIAFRPDGQLMATVLNKTGDKTCTIQFWTYTDREKLPGRQIAGDENPLAVSPNGQWIVTCNQSLVHLYARSTGAIAASYVLPGRLIDLAATDDTHTFALCQIAENLVLQNLADPSQNLLTIPLEGIRDCRLNDDGTNLAVKYEDGRLSVIDTMRLHGSIDILQGKKNEPDGQAGESAQVPYVVAGFSSDSDSISSPMNSERDFIGHSSIAFSHDGKNLVNYNSDDRSFTEYACDGSGQVGTASSSGLANIVCMEYAGDNTTLLYGTPDRLYCFDLKEQKPILNVPLQLSQDVTPRISISRDNSILSYGSLARDGLFIRPAFPSTMEQLSRQWRMKLESPEHLIPLPLPGPAEENNSRIEYSDLLANFWKAWWETVRLRRQLDDLATRSKSGALQDAYKPLDDFFRNMNPVPASAFIAKAREDWELSRSRDVSTEADLAKHIAHASAFPPNEKSLLLDDLKTNVSATLFNSPRYSELKAELASYDSDFPAKCDTEANKAFDLNSPEGNEQAKQLLLLALTRSPNDYSCLIDLAIAYGRLNNDDDAIKTYLKVLNLPDLTPEQRAQAAANLGSRYRQSGQKDKAYASLAAAEAADPTYMLTFQYRAKQLFDDQRYQESLDNYRKALALDATIIVNESGAAQVLFKLGRSEDARAELHVMLDQDRKNPERWTAAADALVMSPEITYRLEGVDDYSEAIRLISNNPDISSPQREQSLYYLFSRRGSQWSMLREYGNAEQDQQAALKCKPGDPWATAELGAIELFLGDGPKAVQLLEKSVENSPDDDWAWNKLAQARLQSDPVELKDAALDAYTHAAKKDDGLFYRGIFYLSLGPANYANAEQDFTESVKRHVNEKWAELWLGKLATIRKRSADNAADHFKKTLVKEAITSGDFCAQSLAYAYLGQFEAADTELAKAEKIDREDSTVPLTRSKIYALQITADTAKRPAASTPAPKTLCLFYLADYVAQGDANAYSLQHEPEFAILSDDSAFNALIAGLRTPWSNPLRKSGVEAFGSSVVAAAQADPNATPEFIAKCIDLKKRLATAPELEGLRQ